MNHLSLFKTPGSKINSDPAPFYSFLDEEFNKFAGGQVGFDILIASAPMQLPPEAVKGFAARYTVIRRFQKITLNLFRASLKGDADPWIADTILSDIPPALAHEYHRKLQKRHMRLPCFFRTDEIAPGVLSEIQCPGSGWANNEALLLLYDAYPELFPGERYFTKQLSKSVADDIHALVRKDPIVYNLIDNSSLPHGSRYFIQKTRAHGIRYYSWDPDIHPRNCNFVRSHDWISLLNNNFHIDHLDACKKGTLTYDLSPMALFDSKVIMALPFEELTGAHYDDEIRSIFPYTRVLRPEGIRAADGSWLSIEKICRNGSLRRDFYLKYGGTDVNMNWGSRAVYALRTHSGGQAEKFLAGILPQVKAGKPWIMQQSFQEKDNISYLTREGDVQEYTGYVKRSGFYGPSGLLGITGYHLHAPKVHGTPRTILSLVR